MAQYELGQNIFWNSANEILLSAFLTLYGL